VVFEHGGQSYRLAALKDGADGHVELDFNRAYGSSCAFTEFATCPLSPEENQLALAVEAGEKYSGTH
jgi:uncharacterized protein (DUF1684 family)